MVLRKSSLAGGALPEPAPDMASPLQSPADAASSSQRLSAASDTQLVRDAQEHGNGDLDNPWAETAEEEQRAERSLPTVRRAESALRSAEDLHANNGLPHLPHWREVRAGTPRSSSDSQRPRNLWEDEETDKAAPAALLQDDGNQHPQSLQVPDTLRDHSTAHSQPKATLPGLSTMKRKPVGAAESSQPSPAVRSPSYEFASNNPFRPQPSGDSLLPHDRPVYDEEAQPWSGLSMEPDASAGKGKEIVRDPPVDGTPVQMTANLSLDDRPFEEYSTSYRPSNINLNSVYRSHAPSAPAPPTYPPPHPPGPPPPAPSFDEQADRVPASPGPLPGQNPWSSEPHSEPLQPYNIRPPTSQPRDYDPDSEFYDGQEMGVVAREPWLPEGQGALHDMRGPPLPARPSLQSLVDDQGPPLPTRRATQNLLDEPGPDLPARHPQPSLLDDPVDDHSRPHPAAPNHAPPKPPRPAVQSVPVDEATLQKLNEQRNETYQIKHFNWFDHNTNSLRRSSMLTQNQNGPCPLLALVNALILGKPDDSHSALGNALRAREQVSLGLLVESLMDELTSDGHANALEELPDVDELNRFLLRLHTGMNANPRFAVPESPPPNLMDARNSVLHVPLSINTDRKPGTFEQTQDLILYGAFAIPLVHGWLPQRSDPARAAFARSAQTYEDAQTIQFGEEELDIKLQQGGLTPNEQQLWEDIVSIRRFFSTYPTQLTPYGLNVVSESLFPGALAIMFRNDHFSTIYKHPETGQLYTLVTDAGYADKDEVVWESLVDVNGQRAEFFSGDFRPVGNVDEGGDSPPQPSSHRNSSSHLAEPLPPPPAGQPPISPQEIQEQHDADFAMALQLQEEEQARQESVNARRRSTQSRTAHASAPPSNIPIRLRPADAGPAVPPRTPRNNPAVNRPADNAPDDDAPPVYEEAVKGAPYIPPPGHPQHPASDPSPRASTSTITPVVSPPSVAPRTAPQRTAAQPPRAPQPPRVPQPQRRLSAYQETQQLGRPDADRPLTHNATMGLHGQPVGRRVQREQEKECAVM